MTLPAADLSALSRLLDEAFELDADAREAWLAALSPAERHLAPILREMLAEHRSSRTSGFLSSLPELGEDACHDAATAAAGDLIGAYRLVREIDRGGMGAVWLAERADGVFKRTLALKLPRLVWGAGLAERMAREREIGALLEHPNIARLYDAGIDGQGRPYLALEYIEGVPIDVWCREQKLGVRDRLSLIVQVARAVSYAHGRLVVHRDLKPSNVLVTADGQSHLLDFGIAKLLNDAAPGEIGLTQEQGRVMTPHYASPEQMRGETITVQSDVYSLGVLAYELLTGQTPYVLKRKTLGALEEAVLEGEPALASSRAVEAGRALRGEIDAILGKALRRDPEQRYATADALAIDIERHLAGERVLAQPDSVWSRTRISLRRHRVGFAAAGAVLVAVLGGAGAAGLQAQRANAEAERTRVVKDFVVDVFKINVRENPANRDLRQIPAELLLERGAALIDTRFAGQPALRAELYGVVAQAFTNMSSSKLASHYAKRSVDALAAIGAPTEQRVSALLLLARTELEQGQLAAAEAQVRPALALSEAGSRRSVQARLLLAEILVEAARYGEAEQELDRVESALTAEPAGTALDQATAKVLRADLSKLHPELDRKWALGQYEQAIQLALEAEGAQSRRAIALRLRLLQRFDDIETVEAAKRHLAAAVGAMRASGGPDDLGAALTEADTYARWFDNEIVGFAEALAAAERSRQILHRGGPLVPKEALARVDLALGWIYRDWEDFEEAIKYTESAVPVLMPSAEAPFDKRLLTIHLGLALKNVGRHVEADNLLRESMAWRKIDDGPVGAAFAAWFVAHNLLMAGRYVEAESVLQQVPAVSFQGMGFVDGLARRHTQRIWARLSLEQGQVDKALQLTQTFDAGILPDETAEANILRGRALCMGGRRSDGLQQMELGLSQGTGSVSPDSPDLARRRALTGLCAKEAGNRPRALVLADLARSALGLHQAVSPYFKAPSVQLDRALGIR